MRRFIALNRANNASIFHDIDFIVRNGAKGASIELSYFDFGLRNNKLRTDGKISYKNKVFNIKHYRILDKRSSQDTTKFLNLVEFVYFKIFVDIYLVHSLFSVIKR